MGEDDNRKERGTQRHRYLTGEERDSAVPSIGECAAQQTQYRVGSVKAKAEYADGLRRMG